MNVVLSANQKSQLLNFVEHNICCSVFQIAVSAGYMTAEERREVLYAEPIHMFVQIRIMMAILMLLDSGEEF